MKKQLLVLLLICAGIQIAAAQKKNADAEQVRRESRKEIIEAQKEQRRTENAAVSTGAGDPETFGKTVKFLGNGVTDAVYVYRSCDPAILLAELQLTLAPGERCVAHAGGAATTTAVFDDLGSISLPGRSADNLITYVVNSTIFNDYENLNSPTQLFTSFIYAPRLTIESAALNDPAAVNPSTGLPLNGAVTFTLGSASKFENRTIQPGSFEAYDDNRSHVATRGLSRSFFADYGLPQSVINNLYRQPMTIKFGMRVSVRNVFFGQYFYSARFLGN